MLILSQLNDKGKCIIISSFSVSHTYLDVKGKQVNKGKLCITNNNLNQWDEQIQLRFSEKKINNK
jgi:hypothetical protein